MSKLLTDPEVIRRFVTAGDATFTISSRKTGARYTYKAAAIPETKNKFWLRLLTGPDNEEDFTYLGMIDNDAFRRTGASKFSDDATPVIAARFFCRTVLREKHVPQDLEVRHAGRCGRCNRPLTVPSSIDSGLGPSCAKKVK